MKIVVTVSEIVSQGDWDAFCKLKRLRKYWIVQGRNKGSRFQSHQFTLTVEEIRQIGLQSAVIQSFPLDAVGMKYEVAARFIETN